MKDLKLIHLKPSTRETIWGHETLLVSGREENSSIVDDDESPVHGKTLFELSQDLSARLLGNKCPMPGKFPLLAKVLHADSSLSLQVHPSHSKDSIDEAKTEMWMSLGQSTSFIGLKDKSIGKTQLANMLDQSITDKLNKFSLDSRQMVLIEAGMVHALVKGDVFEVSQSSNTTYRLYDWDRLGRQLDIEKAIDAIDSSLAIPTIEQASITCPFFKCTYCPNGIEIKTDKDTFSLVYMASSGNCVLVPADIGNNAVAFRQDCVVVNLV